MLAAGHKPRIITAEVSSDSDTRFLLIGKCATQKNQCKFEIISLFSQ
jgi:hypothetical protein